MPIFELTGLLILGLVVWFWHDSFKAREAGMSAVRAGCAAEGLQLLDDTVALAAVMPARNDDGQLALRRVYEFEYSDTGDNRQRGSVVLLGQEVIVVDLGSRWPPNVRTLH